MVQVVEVLEPFGARIGGVDITNDSHIQALRRLLTIHRVLVLPAHSAPEHAPALHENTSLTKLAEAVSDGSVMENHPLNETGPGGVVTLVTNGGGLAVGGNATSNAKRFHSDKSWAKDPCQVSVLSPSQVPSSGGSTLFVDANTLYSTLPESLRNRLEPMNIIHGFTTPTPPAMLREEFSDSTSFIHPAVITHPWSGKPILFMSPTSIAGVVDLSDEDTAELWNEISAIYDKVPILGHEWTCHEVVLFDNIALQHCAADDYNERRVMRRVLAGQRSFRPQRYVANPATTAVFEAASFQELISAAISSFDRAVVEIFAVVGSPSLDKLAVTVFGDHIISKLLLRLARLPVFSKDFTLLFEEQLEVLNILKKLKFFINLKIRETLYLLSKLCVVYPGGAAKGWHITKFFDVDTRSPQVDQLVDLKFKRAIRHNFLTTTKRDEYLSEFECLEKTEPHAIYPTSIYRHCDGFSVATKDSKRIESIMSTTLTSSIHISSHVLGFDSNLLAEIYRPLGSVVIVLDDKLDDPLYTSGDVDVFTNKRLVLGMEKNGGRFQKMSIREQIDCYFSHHKIEVKIILRSGNEAHKDIKNVQEILADLKKLGVMRNEPVLVVGGGVIADIAGFACALFHRNTPYIMLATSVVAGIDAGPSPRTCCDGQGYKNAFGAFHPPVVTLTDRTLWTTMHRGMIRHGLAEIVKMAVTENGELFELLEKVGPKYLVKQSWEPTYLALWKLMVSTLKSSMPIVNA